MKTITVNPNVSQEMFDQFKPDFGIAIKKLKKTSYKMDITWFGKELLCIAHNEMIVKPNEITMTVPLNEKEYCATFVLKPGVKKAMLLALVMGKNMVLTIKPGPLTTSINGEQFRIVNVTKCKVHKDGYDVGGDMIIAMPGVSKTLIELAMAFDNMKQVNVEMV